jgi:hypothetical protein
MEHQDLNPVDTLPEVVVADLGVIQEELVEQVVVVLVDLHYQSMEHLELPTLEEVVEELDILLGVLVVQVVLVLSLFVIDLIRYPY